jgi:hypothetical protein
MDYSNILELRFDRDERRANREREEQGSAPSSSFAKYTDEQMAEAYRRVEEVFGVKRNGGR